MYVQNCEGVFMAVICFWMEVEVEGAEGICFGSGCSGTTALCKATGDFPSTICLF